MTKAQRDRLRSLLGPMSPREVKHFFQMAERAHSNGESFARLEMVAARFARAPERVQNVFAYHAQGRLELFADQAGAEKSRAAAPNDQRVSPIASELAKVMR